MYAKLYRALPTASEIADATVLTALGKLADAPAEYPSDMLAKRRAAFRKMIETHDADNGIWDGSDTSTEEQSKQSGYGSFGPM